MALMTSRGAATLALFALFLNLAHSALLLPPLSTDLDSPVPTIVAQHQWIYSEWNMTCGHTECHSGVYTRDAWCFYTASDGSAPHQQRRVPDGDCITAQIPPAILREPCNDSPLVCPNGFTCVENQDPRTSAESMMTCLRDDEDPELTTFQLVAILIFFLIAAGILLAALLCIWIKCHIPPFHGRNSPSPDHYYSPPSDMLMMAGDKRPYQRVG